MSKKVLCIGGVTTDVIVSPVDSLPQPGLLKSVNSISTYVGGCAANAAVDLAKLGTDAALCCKVGADSFGSFVIETVKKNEVDARGVVMDERVTTSASIVCINSSGERCFLYNPGSTSRLCRADIPQNLIDEADIVFIAEALMLDDFDGAQGTALMKECRQAGKFTVMDTAWDKDDVWLPKIRETIKYLDLFMPSREEAEKLSGKNTLSDIADVFFELGAKNVIIKAGKVGAYVCEENGERYIMPAYKGIEVKDTTGAGDSFCAGFICGLTQGWSFRECAAFANAVGAHCVTEIGASSGIKPMKDILKFMELHKEDI